MTARMLGLLVALAACGGKKDEAKHGDGSSEPASTPTPTPSKPAVKRGGDDAACTKTMEKVEQLYKVENPDLVYAMLSQMKDGEVYQGMWRLCTRWWTDADLACMTAANDVAALSTCGEASDVLSIDASRDVPACAGGVVAQLSCPEGAWKNDKVCVPAPPGFTATPGGNTTELTYPDGTSIRVHVGDGSECAESLPRLIGAKYTADELFDECRWPRGVYVALDPLKRDEPRLAKAQICSGGSSITCSARNAPKLEAACKAIQVIGPEEPALDLKRLEGGHQDKTAAGAP